MKELNWDSACAAVLPCLNEAGTIANLVAGVRAYLPSVVVVDDGSTDGTAELAVRSGAEVLRHVRSLGKGAALAAGWRRCAERGFSWVLTLDGDGQHSPSDIPSFFRCAVQSDARLIVGNRMSAPAHMPGIRLWVNRWMSRRISRLLGAELPDTQCGFRLIHLATLTGLQLRSQSFEIESEMIVAFVRAAYAVKFVPVQSIYTTEQSKIHVWRDTRRWFHWWLQARREN